MGRKERLFNKKKKKKGKKSVTKEKTTKKKHKIQFLHRTKIPQDKPTTKKYK